MPNLAVVLKEEIQRLARKELRQQIGSTVAASAQHRRDIAAMKREIHDLKKAVAFLELQEKKRLGRKPPAETAEGARFSPSGLKAHRKRLGLSARSYAKLIGVSGLTVYNWESSKSRPRRQQLAAIVAVRALGKREAAKQLTVLGG